MEKIYQHIEKLLAQHDYVVVPNLGGFVSQIQSAAILPDRIIPPLSTIGFNPLMHHSDGLLAIEIARTEGISYRAAMQLLDREIDKITLELNMRRKVQIGNLGTLNQNESGNIEFSPAPDADFLPQNFGLTNLYVAKRNISTDNTQTAKTITLRPRNIFKYAAACFLFGGLLLFSPQVNDVRQADYAAFVPLNFLNTIETLNATDSLTGFDTFEDIQDKTESEETHRFHVIVASLPTQSSAEKLCNNLTANNFSNAHVLEPSKTYRVAIQSFENRDSAIVFMENLRKSDSRFETAWVLCN